MSKKIKEPIFLKNKPDKRHYKELSFGDYLRIQNACQDAANRMGYPIYLVGGALKDHTPRDIDISIIVPAKEYYEKYLNGHNEITNPEYQAFHFMSNAYHIEFENLEELTKIMFEWIMLDIKICPDNWFKDKPKMLLAKPSSKELSK